MRTLHIQMHPGVVQKRGTHFSRNSSAHLNQGELTSSCGLTAILMATIVLGIATRSYVRQLRYGTEGELLVPLWTKAQQTFVQGASHEDMLALFGTLDRYVRYEAQQGSMTKVLHFTLERLAKNDLVVLGLGNPEAQWSNHWVLAVGVASQVAKSRVLPSGVLCLDSVIARPQLAPYNAQLELDSPKRGAKQLHYRGVDGRASLVSCTSAIALRVR